MVICTENTQITATKALAPNGDKHDKKKQSDYAENESILQKIRDRVVGWTGPEDVHSKG